MRNPTRVIPDAARWLLLLAALEGTGDLAVLAAATGTAVPAALATLAAAERQGLVRIGPCARHLEFRDPPGRAALVDGSTADQRRRAHQALADALAGHPERRARHLAEATVEPDEGVAALLQDAAVGLLRRGDPGAAITTLTRAAELSPDGADRARRLARAAFVGAHMSDGGLRPAARLLSRARLADPADGGSPQAAAVSAFLMLNGAGDLDTAHRLLVGALEAAAPDPGTADEGLIAALFTLFLLCAYGRRAPLWPPLLRLLERLGPAVPVELTLLVTAFADPVRTAVPALPRLDAAIADAQRGAVDPWQVRTLGFAAVVVDRLAGLRDAARQVIHDSPESGTVALAVMIHLCLDAFVTGDWDELDRLARDGLRRCHEQGLRLFDWLFRYVLALLAAVRGEWAGARARTGEILDWAAPRGVDAAEVFVHHARGLAALGQGDAELAYHHAGAINPPGTFAPHVPQALWSCLDLVEAAVRTHRHAQARAHVAAMGAVDLAALSPRLALLAGGAAALVAPGRQAHVVFDRTLAAPGVDRWPFDQARVRLLYGERLRRAGTMAAARVQLGAALEIFERLGAHPWAARAGSELRATGQSRLPAGARAGGLTPHEREIAALAAAGLTNKQIAQRLYLSHRTVSSHLYRIFPKLGVATRAALRDALASQDGSGGAHRTGPV